MLDSSRFSHIPWRNLKESRRISKNLEESERVCWGLKWSEAVWKRLREFKIFQILSFSLRLFFSNSLDSFWFSLPHFSDCFELFQILSNFSDSFRHHQKSSRFFRFFYFCSDCFRSLQIFSDSCRLFQIVLDSFRFC